MTRVPCSVPGIPWQWADPVPWLELPFLSPLLSRPVANGAWKARTCAHQCGNGPTALPSPVLQERGEVRARAACSGVRPSQRTSA
jgi:hypothetical protein